MALRPDGWRVRFGRGSGDRPAALNLAWSGRTVLARRGMVWEYAMLVRAGESETWVGGDHGFEHLLSLRHDRYGAERATTLRRPDGLDLARLVISYRVQGPTLTLSYDVAWLADVEWTRRYAGMLPCAPWMNDVCVGGDRRTLALGDIVWSDEPCQVATARGRGWTGTLEVDAPCVMSAHARRDGRTVKLYGNAGPGGARAGDVEKRQASFTFRRPPW